MLSITSSERAPDGPQRAPRAGIDRNMGAMSKAPVTPGLLLEGNEFWVSGWPSLWTACTPGVDSAFTYLRDRVAVFLL